MQGKLQQRKIYNHNATDISKITKMDRANQNRRYYEDAQHILFFSGITCAGPGTTIFLPAKDAGLPLA